jgi:hypothetical protein
LNDLTVQIYILSLTLSCYTKRTSVYLPPPHPACHLAPPDIVKLKLSFLNVQKEAKELIIVVQYYAVK